MKVEILYDYVAVLAVMFVLVLSIFVHLLYIYLDSELESECSRYSGFTKVVLGSKAWIPAVQVRGRAVGTGKSEWVQ